MDKYQEVRIQCIKKADEMVETMVFASQDPTRQITGETLVIYKEFNDWDWFSQYPLDKIENQNLLKKIISINLYKHEKYIIDHPEAKPLTKWERVMGRVRK